jgi:hypothetical protein
MSWWPFIILPTLSETYKMYGWTSLLSGSLKAQGATKCSEELHSGAIDEE